MTIAYLRVTFPKTDTLKYNNPKSWHCLDFKTCSYWQPAKSISWVDLPYDKFAVFFETRDCRAEGKYVFTSADGLTSGINKFLNPQSIRSMMIGEDHNHTRHPVATHFLCPVVYETIAKSSSDEAVNKTYEFDWSSDDGSVADGGLSSNWYGALPNENEVPG
ncbi:hypothetical protein PRIC1_003977 [Phytophthora ramorum]